MFKISAQLLLYRLLYYTTKNTKLQKHIIPNEKFNNEKHSVCLFPVKKTVCCCTTADQKNKKDTKNTYSFFKKLIKVLAFFKAYPFASLLK